MLHLFKTYKKAVNTPAASLIITTLAVYLTSSPLTFASQPRAMAEWERTDAVVFSFQKYVSTIFSIDDYLNPPEAVEKHGEISSVAQCVYLKTAFEAIIDADANIVIVDDINGDFESFANTCDIEITDDYTIVHIEDDGSEIYPQCSSMWTRDEYPYTVYQNNHETRSAAGIWKCDMLADILGIDSVLDQNRALSAAGIPRTLEDILSGVPPQPGAGLYVDGGNFMTDGHGRLINEEIISVKPEENAELVNEYYREFMGITDIISLPYAQGHIDYHTKLLDEETLLITKFIDESSSDYLERLEQDSFVQEVITNTPSWTGRPYKIFTLTDTIKEFNPDYGMSSVSYYANSLIVNDTVLVGTAHVPGVYEARAQDAQAKALYNRIMPGYKVVMLPYAGIVQSAGRGGIHCMTSVLGDPSPIYIGHKWLDGDVTFKKGKHTISAELGASQGILKAIVYWREKGQDTYKLKFMSTKKKSSSSKKNNSKENTVIYTATFDNIKKETEIEYYIEVSDFSGKKETKPFVAPNHHYSFTVK